MKSSAIRLTGLFANLLLGGCAGAFDAYEGPLAPDSMLAIIRGGLVDSIGKDGHSYYDRQRDGLAIPIRLQPGSYEITYSYSCYKSPEARSTETLALMAGHVYRAEYACGSSFFGLDYMTHLWFEDETTNRIIAGSKPS